jgi:hypothetical protein
MQDEMVSDLIDMSRPQDENEENEEASDTNKLDVIEIESSNEEMDEDELAEY